jgi:hypothetical protein
MRFSLRWLFVAMAIVAVASLGLVNANRWWVVGATVGVLLLTTAAASRVFLYGRKAAFSFGFAATVFLVRCGFFVVGMPPIFALDAEDLSGGQVIAIGSQGPIDEEHHLSAKRLKDDLCLIGVATLSGLIAVAFAGVRPPDSAAKPE